MSAALSAICSACATCCIEPIVPVTGRDLRRIRDATGRRADEVTCLYTKRQAAYDPASDLWIRFSYGRRMLGLRKRGDRCGFLTGERLCSIYVARPLTCRTFPFVDGVGGAMTINAAVKCRLLPSHARRQRDLEGLLRREDCEDEEFCAMIDTWNARRRRGGKRAFLRWIGVG